MDLKINSEVFRHEDTANMAWLIYRRWARDIKAAACAWRRLLQNSCTDDQFLDLLTAAPMNDNKDPNVPRDI